MGGDATSTTLNQRHYYYYYRRRRRGRSNQERITSKAMHLLGKEALEPNGIKVIRTYMHDANMAFIIVRS